MEEGKEVIHRIKRDGIHLVLCDKNGDPIPRQTSLKIESDVDSPIKVTMTCYVESYEIEDGVFKERKYVVQEEKEYFDKWLSQ